MAVKVSGSVRSGLLREKAAAETLEKAISQAVYDVADDVFARATMKAPVDLGTLRKSGAVRYGPGPQAEVAFTSRHAAPVEFGSRPHMPPVEPIYRWVKRNVVVFGGERHVKPERLPEGRRRAGPLAVKDREAWDLAWAIAKKIAREGSKPVNFLSKALEEAIAAAPSRFEARIKGAVSVRGPAG